MVEGVDLRFGGGMHGGAGGTLLDLGFESGTSCY